MLWLFIRVPLQVNTWVNTTTREIQVVNDTTVAYLTIKEKA